MINKLVILAGGVSSRMKKSLEQEQLLNDPSLADAKNKPKSMIRIGKEGRPFLDYLIMNAKKTGINDITIVISEKDNSIKEYYDSIINENWLKEIKISYAYQKIPEGRQKPLGTADALLEALLSREDWKGEKFLMTNSDNLYSQNAMNILIHSEHKNALIDYNREGLKFEKSRVSSFAVTLKDDENYLVDILEKPSEEQVKNATSSDGVIGVSMNIFMFSYDLILPYLKITPLSQRNEKELPTSIKMMINENPKSLYCYPLKEHVPDLTSKDDIKIVQEYLENEFNEN
ncbi:MAG: sugar phosphate nucleotidyltransferase [Melioribacteraceae bacterium]|nr:sugar phosphate nucleotidyltransferase [Melioribacteraceae bacterium]